MTDASIVRGDQIGGISRRSLLQAPAAAIFATALPAAATAQGFCSDGYKTSACPLSRAMATRPIPPVFAPTGWRTTALDHITFQMPEYRKEAAFYIALMGWTLRSDDGRQAVLDIGRWGSAVFKEAPEQQRAVVQSFGFVIDPWDASVVEAELRNRGLDPVREDDGHGFQSFLVKDPGGWILQLGNGLGLATARHANSVATLETPAPFAPTGWTTNWLDHLSFDVPDYKQVASFYSNLLGWRATYDEGSQQELLIGDVGDAIVRGGNRFAPNPLRDASRPARIDHISFGISPWDTLGVKAALEARGLQADVDTASKVDVGVAAYKSYHTRTPNGFNLQISGITRNTRLTLSKVVRPKPAPSGSRTDRHPYR